jgi:hypothetical protein
MPARELDAHAATALESIPPLTSKPTGTSLSS